jgi:2-methylcitrate dehydratase PrpD
VIDACLAVRAQPAFSIEKVAEVVIRGSPLLKARADRPDVTTGREAQVSAQHAAAISLLRGTAGASDFSDAAVNDPEVKALSAKVRRVEVDAGISVEAAHVSIIYAGGVTIESFEKAASGSLTRPMTDAALKEKFAALANYGCPALDAGPLAERLSALPGLADAGAVMALARPQAPSPRRAD